MSQLLWTHALIVCSGFSVGYLTGRAPLHADMARQTATYATEKAQLAQAAVATLQAAAARGDALSAGLLAQQSHIDQLKTEKRHAIVNATTGRPCLDGTALRLLDGAPGLSVHGLPPPASGAAAAGGPVATDTDLAGWIVDAGATFEVCRTRLNALIDWYP